ncbi:16S rRNA (cytosine(1402)-N(4))-methyltransferase [Candidatus Marinamargulisbacteria bacterium SCGC AG-410-N11]|nr:16S rRNA (cytosine(1402)-N(4))-methyltransferase [Candidatus Marinamargulisbacteria bacterium SCGC AG-410-N11]
MEQSIHIPIMAQEIISFLDPKPNTIIFDGTIGFGGHASQILPLISKGHYYGFDQDHYAFNFCQNKFKDNISLKIYHMSYSEGLEFLKKQKILVDFVLLDLGISSYHIDLSERGFTFLQDQPLDMRMNLTNSLTAKKILNTYTIKDLSDIFYNFGELFQNKILSQNIINYRKKHTISTTFQLIELIKQSYRFNNNRRKFIKTCSQVFQALRIETNNELGELNLFLEQLTTILSTQAKIAILSFHSIEDRIVKRFFKKNKQSFSSFTKKVITSSKEELQLNSRAKSAKLRLYQYKANS